MWIITQLGSGWSGINEASEIITAYEHKSNGFSHKNITGTFLFIPLRYRMWGCYFQCGCGVEALRTRHTGHLPRQHTQGVDFTELGFLSNLFSTVE